MEIGFTGVLFHIFKLAIIITTIIMVVTIGIKRYKRFMKRNKEIDEKPDYSFEELEKNKIKNKLIMAITIAINIISVIVFPISLLVAVVSPMTFDAPGSTEQFSNWIFFFATLSFPVVILVAVITSLIFLFTMKSYKTALGFSVLPIINIITVILVFAA